MAHQDRESGSARIGWRDWSKAAFAEASERDRLVLLTSSAFWSADTRALDERVLADSALVDLVESSLVPVRFDADRMPHVRDRYNSAGWPIVALLTPHGEVLWAGATRDAAQLRGFLAQATGAWRTRREEIEQQIRMRELAGSASRSRHAIGMVRREAADDVLTAAQASFDTRNGGFGDSFKMVAPDIVELLLAQGARLENPDWVEMASRTLEGMVAGEISDAERGGFFRLARQPDWTGPSTEKLLETNAWALRAFGIAAHVLRRADWADVAARTVEWADKTLGLENGLWGGSQAAHDAYYEGRAHDAPPVDRTVYTDATAQWIAALAEVGGRLRRPEWVEHAARALDTLCDTMRAPDGLLYHYRPENGSPALVGLLSDVAETARACVAVAQATGQPGWLQRAGAFADALISQFWADEGGFCDIAPCVDRIAGLRHVARPFETNATAAALLVDLSVLEGGRAWRAPAERALATLSPLAGRYGIAAAGFALAVEHHFEPPRSFVVVGRGESARNLRAAALALPLLDRQVWTLPDGGSVGGRRFEPTEPAVVYACSTRRCSAPISRPEELSVDSPPAR